MVFASIAVARNSVTARHGANKKADSKKPSSTKKSCLTKLASFIKSSMGPAPKKQVKSFIPRITPQDDARDNYITAIARQNSPMTEPIALQDLGSRSALTQSAQSSSSRQSRFVEHLDDNEGTTLVSSTSASSPLLYERTLAMSEQIPRNEIFPALGQQSSHTTSSATLIDFAWLGNSIELSRPANVLGNANGWKCCKCGNKTSANQDTCINQKCQHARCSTVCSSFIGRNAA